MSLQAQDKTITASNCVFICSALCLTCLYLWLFVNNEFYFHIAGIRAPKFLHFFSYAYTWFSVLLCRGMTLNSNSYSCLPFSTQTMVL